MSKFFYILFFHFSFLSSITAFSSNVFLDEIERLSESIRGENGWPKFDDFHPFFAENLKNNIEFMQEEIEKVTNKNNC